VVLAFSRENHLGVDIESFNRDSNLEKLAHYSFSKKEISQIEALEGEGYRDRFFSLWTLKEAYMKADGRGMSLPLKSFSFVFDKENKSLVGFESSHVASDENWLFWQYETPFDSYISMALRSEFKDCASYEVKLKNITGFSQAIDCSLPLCGSLSR
jgi:4'-phosphopantetheinyl transferase